MSSLIVSVNTTSASLPAGNQITQLNVVLTAGANQFLTAPIARVNVSSTTTVYCPVQASFGTSTMSVTGYIRARRMR